MCGIVGYVGDKDVVPLLVEGLKSLEYRGYDSAGIATLDGGKISICRCSGKMNKLEELLSKQSLSGKMGVGHTRWATHGQPSEENAHPHTDCSGKLVVVHNGIIENYLSLKLELEAEGHQFRSDTDTEVIAHLIEKYLTDGLEEAVSQALAMIEGSYALAVISEKEHGKLIAARSGSPLILGLGDNEYFAASDIPAILRYTRNVIYMDDGEIAVLSREGVEVRDMRGNAVSKEVNRISWDISMAEKEGYSHFMIKEIFEQPRAIEETMRGKIAEETGNVHLEEMQLSPSQLKKVNRIVLSACGTSWHAGLIGEYLLEEFTRIPVEVEYAAEFRYRGPILDRHCLVIAISQSGETADTMAAVKEARSRGAKVLSICNVIGSSIARESDAVIYTHAGPEIGVASTKAFTTQLTILYLFTIYMGRLHGIVTEEKGKQMLADLRRIPEKVKQMLQKSELIKGLSEKFYQKKNFLYLGRGKGFAVALEGALKLKEVSYIHAEGYPAAEMKHGPIALIDENMPVVVLALTGRRYEKILGNIEEVKARRGVVIALATEGDTAIAEKVDEVIYVPETSVPLSPILAVVPLQLLAYYTAVRRGCPVDQPRNLAKSVTVE